MHFATPRYNQAPLIPMKRAEMNNGEGWLQQKPVFLPHATWSALKRLSWQQGRSESEVMASLISIADGLSKAK